MEKRLTLLSRAVIVVTLVAACGEPGRPADSSHAVVALDAGTSAVTPAPAAADGADVPPVLVDNFSASVSHNRPRGATGPAGLYAQQAGHRVTLWNLARRTRLGEIELSDERRGGRQRRSLTTLSFIGSDRLVLGCRASAEVVELRDTTSRQRFLFDRPLSVIEGTDDGMLIGFDGGEVRRYGGDRLARTASWQLPSAADRITSVTLAGERIFVTTNGHLFLLDGDDVSEVPLPLGDNPRAPLDTSTNGNGELVVAIGDRRLLRLSLATLAVTGETTSEPVLYARPRVECNAEAHLCYWMRRKNVEFWRDDFSSRLAIEKNVEIVDKRTGRAVRSWQRHSKSDHSAQAVYAVADRIGGEWRSMGFLNRRVGDVLWSSREGELILTAGGAHALQLTQLTARSLPDTRGPIAVGHDGRVIGTWDHGVIVVHGPDLTEERRAYPQGCNQQKMARLEQQTSDAAFDALLELQRQCERLGPQSLWAAPSLPLVALDAKIGEIRVFDYASGRWVDRFRFGKLLDIEDDFRAAALAWSPENDEIQACISPQLFKMGRGRPQIDNAGIRGSAFAVAQNSRGVTARADLGNDLELRGGAADKAVKLSFRPDTIIAGPEGQWVAMGESKAALIVGEVVVAEHSVGPGGTRRGLREVRSDVRWSGGQPILATQRKLGGVLLTRMRDGQQLVVSLVSSGRNKLVVIARSGDRYSAPPEAREFLHYRRGGSADLLGPTESAAPALEPTLVESFLSGE